VTPSWYDVLDVDDDATPAEIRTAWKAAIADLDPGDRRFRLANQAAEVLLDPAKREAHDAELERDAAEPIDADEADEPDEPEAVSTPVSLTKPARTEPEAEEDTDDEDDRPARASSKPVVGSLLATLPKAVLALAVVALVLVVVTVVALVQGRDASAAEDGGLPTEQRVEDARGAAEAAVVPVLSYDYRTLEDDQAEAKTYLTDEYAQEYERFFAAAVETNAPRTQTVVRVRVLESAVVRTGKDRVDVLLFVNRPTINKQRRVEYRDQVTMRMLDVDGTWLVDCLITTNTGPCERD
jgi:Mce-associated membrane protein